jgi:hypothetical protein
MGPVQRPIADGISRRKMLKRVGAGAAVAWTAPVLLTIRTPAYGQASGTCRIQDCSQPHSLCGPGSGCEGDCGGQEDQICARMLDDSCFCGLLPECGFCETDQDCERMWLPGSRCGPTVNCDCPGDRGCFLPC